jgi:hypothetical protein
MGESQDETAFSRWGYAQFFLRAGFAEVGALPFDFLHPATPQMLVSLVDRVSDLLERIPGVKEFAGSVVVFGEK